MTVLRLVALGLLSDWLVEAVLGVRLQCADMDIGHSYYERMMAHDAYRRCKGGGIRQVRWA
ncbi:MAG: hypothetical protein HPY52_16940 [Firmicutes bacterium]|nr:hypothetical protein [Bacillota bacterium]